MKYIIYTNNSYKCICCKYSLCVTDRGFQFFFQAEGLKVWSGDACYSIFHNQLIPGLTLIQDIVYLKFLKENTKIMHDKIMQNKDCECVPTAPEEDDVPESSMIEKAWGLLVKSTLDSAHHIGFQVLLLKLDKCCWRHC